MCNFNRARRTTVGSSQHHVSSTDDEVSLDSILRRYSAPCDNENATPTDDPSAPKRFSRDSKVTSSFAARPHFSVRMTQRNVLFAERKRLSDFALVFGLTGIVLMILETELNMARVYDKVRFYSALCHSTIVCINLIIWA